MSAKLLDGRLLAKAIAERSARRAEAVREARGAPPLLGVLRAGDDPAARIYAERGLAACRKAGLDVRVVALDEPVAEKSALEALKALAQDPSVDAVLIETPLPKGVSLERLLELVPPAKDVEGIGAVNSGRLYGAKSWAALEAAGVPLPPTAAAAIELAKASGIALAGAEAVVVGRSAIVGRPAAHLLSCLDATVTLCHSRTRDLKTHLRRADLVVAAIGRARFVRGEWLKPGAVVVDAGVNAEGGNLIGDVEPEGAAARAAWITPVPGGVGPVTTALLVSNAVLLAERSLASLRQA